MNGIEDPNDCYENSNSFNEGCMSYTEEVNANFEDDIAEDMEDYENENEDDVIVNDKA